MIRAAILVALAGLIACQPWPEPADGTADLLDLDTPEAAAFQRATEARDFRRVRSLAKEVPDRIAGTALVICRPDHAGEAPALACDTAQAPEISEAELSAETLVDGRLTYSRAEGAICTISAAQIAALALMPSELAPIGVTTRFPCEARLLGRLPLVRTQGGGWVLPLVGFDRDRMIAIAIPGDGIAQTYTLIESIERGATFAEEG